jgi:hypothetical protein
MVGGTDVNVINMCKVFVKADMIGFQKLDEAVEVEVDEAAAIIVRPTSLVFWNGQPEKVVESQDQLGRKVCVPAFG